MPTRYAPTRYALIISDRTGLTAEALTHSLLSQFPKVKFNAETLPFVDTIDKAQEISQKINLLKNDHGVKPLVFATLVSDQIREIILSSDGVFFDLFGTFIDPLEKELEIESSHSVGKSHGVVDVAQYSARIAAVNFAIGTDDGMDTDHYGGADVVVVGVSRSGKTPTCLYLSLQFGIYAANFPLTHDDLDPTLLPSSLAEYRDRLFGLTIDPFRLQQIRQERYAGETYADPKTCQYEVATAESMFRSCGIPFVNTTKMSVEEIGAYILHRAGLRRKF